jgi:hypothetical protein
MSHLGKCVISFIPSLQLPLKFKILDPSFLCEVWGFGDWKVLRFVFFFFEPVLCLLQKMKPYGLSSKIQTMSGMSVWMRNKQMLFRGQGERGVKENFKKVQTKDELLVVL